MVDKTTKAYQEGLQAAKDKKTPRHNPYRQHEPEYKEWFEGLLDGSL